MHQFPDSNYPKFGAQSTFKFTHAKYGKGKFPREEKSSPFLCKSFRAWPLG